MWVCRMLPVGFRLRARLAWLGSGHQFSVTANVSNHISNMTYYAAGEVITNQFGDQFTWSDSGDGAR